MRLQDINNNCTHTHPLSSPFLPLLVVETLYKQNNDLQRSLECLQTSDQHLRVSLKMAEMRAQEAEIKLQHSSDRCHKLERDCRWLETEFKILYQKYHDLQKHLQKKAILNQMAMDHKAVRTKLIKYMYMTEKCACTLNGANFCGLEIQCFACN